MKTQIVDITEDSWTEITNGSTVLLAEGGVCGSFYLHFANSQTPPEITAPAHRIQTFQAAFDFSNLTLQLGQRIFARSENGPAFLIVTREVDVYEGFIPSGSDALITRNGNTFKSKETV